MKQLSIGLFSFLLAITMVSFTETSVTRSAKSGAYWFELDASGNQVPTFTPPALVVSDPYGCVAMAPVYCSRAFTSYQMIPGSSPAQYRGSGAVLATHFKF